MQDHRHTTPRPTGVGAVRPQHVYVSVTGVWGQEANPGVLLEWRRTVRNRTGWEALVIYVRVGGATGWTVAQGWVDAEHVRPGKTAP